MALSLKLSQQALALVAVPLAFELCFVGILDNLLKRAQDARNNEQRSKQLIADANDLFNLAYNEGTTLMAYSFTKSAKAIKHFDDLERRFQTGLTSLRLNSLDDDKQIEQVSRIEYAHRRGTEIIAGFRNAPVSLATLKAQNVDEELTTISDTLVATISEFIQYEKRKRNSTPESQQRYDNMIQSCLRVGVAFNVVLAIALAWRFNKSITRRLNILMGNTVSLAKEEPLSPPVTGSDEIAQLDTFFRQMADQLAEASAKRRELERLKQEFVAMVSHDIRSPLSSFHAFLTLLEDGVYGQLDERGQVKIGELEAEMERLVRLISDLLEMEKSEAGTLSMNPVKTDAVTVIERSIGSLEPLAQRQEVTLRFPGHTSIPMYADEERLVQVLINLMSNALKFSPKGSTITVSTKENGHEVKFIVQDQGPGIAPEFQELIFERFKQVPGNTKPGAGLGLAICKQIVLQHQGEIGVESKPGHGAAFWFKIPLDQIDDPDSAIPS